MAARGAIREVVVGEGHGQLHGKEVVAEVAIWCLGHSALGPKACDILGQDNLRVAQVVRQAPWV